MDKRWLGFFVVMVSLLFLMACGQEEEKSVTETRIVQGQSQLNVQKEPRQLGYSYVPHLLEDEFEKVQKPKRQEVRGIYLNREAIKSENIDQYIELVKSSPKFNAVVMDLKDDNGKLTYNSNIDLVNEINADQGYVIDDLEQFLQRFKDEGIYTIARIVTFKDPYVAEQKTEWALEKKDGSTWIGPNNVKWIDPYKKDMWNYVLDIVEEISASGIDEIQYDYIRFPENAQKVDQEVAYANKENLKKDELIENFLELSNKRLEKYPVLVSADVFGLVTSSEDDMGIGQIWERISPQVDFISPMTYPSHYSPHSYGIIEPNDHPYELIKSAMEDAIKHNKQLEEEGKDVASIRPWLQDFDYKRNYTKEDVLNQIRALNDLGINEYLLWNPASNYTQLN